MKIPITKPFLPPLEEYQQYLAGIWQRQWLTNKGPLAVELEVMLQNLLDVKHLLFVTNGTVALQMAIKALDLKGEIITTPFSFVATTSSIVWEGCTPVFVDIDQETLNIDATKIEAAVTDKTSAILATHVYGNPCDVLKIDEIAKKHNLKVIYDGAHAFGVNVYGKSIFDFGDISICSLHATKLYHSSEGGFMTTSNRDLLKKIEYIRNFGISSFDTFAELGINGKNSEFHAAMGLTNLKYIQDIIDRRLALTLRYDTKLEGLKGYRPKWHSASTNQGAYYPIILETEDFLLEIIAALNKENIGSRRYFYPSLATSLPYLLPKKLKVTDDISKRVLCLPLYFDLTNEDVDLISMVIMKTQKSLA